MIWLWVFLGLWTAFAAVAFHKKASLTISIGGGFVFSVFTLVAALFVADIGSDNETTTAPPAHAQNVHYTPHVLYSEGLQGDNLKAAKKAVAIFSKICRPLMSQYKNDIESISVSLWRNKNDDGSGWELECRDYRCEDYHWIKSIYLQVKIKDETSLIPRSLYAWGHNLHFFLGGPNNPGITTSKRPQLCGIEKPEPSRDVFIPVGEIGTIWD